MITMFCPVYAARSGFLPCSSLFYAMLLKQPESRQISLMVNEFHKFFNWDKYTIKKSGGEITPGLPLHTKSSRPGVGY